MSAFQDAKYKAAKEGRLFVGNAAAAGAVLPIFSNTAQVFGLWNPSGSKVNGIICDVAATYVSTTGAAGGYVIGIMKNAGAGLATGGISAWTDGVPERGLSGEGSGGNTIRFTPSAATVIAPTILRHLGWNQLVTTAADATTVPWQFYREFHGDLILPPNAAIFLAGNIATLSVWAASIKWFEEPRNN
jgi:hypothetical protein